MSLINMIVAAVVALMWLLAWALNAFGPADGQTECIGDSQSIFQILRAQPDKMKRVASGPIPRSEARVEVYVSEKTGTGVVVIVWDDIGACVDHYLDEVYPSQ